MKFLSIKIKNRKLALLAAGLLSAFGAQAASAQATSPIKTVWYILLENRNWTENETGGGQQILGSSAAPFLNSLVTPGNPNAAQVSYCSCYHNVLSTYNGQNPSIHPSEPNYVWMECGSNLSKADDNDPYGSGASVQQMFNYAAANPTLTTQNLCALFQNAGLTWKSYTEGVNLQNTASQNFNTAGGTLTANPVPYGLWTVPLVSFSGGGGNSNTISGTTGSFATNPYLSYTNPYNGSHQFNFAAKHTGSLFFPATNGSTINTANTMTSNIEATNYPPLAQLANDLANGTVANYNVITPDQYNDMHTALSANWTSPETGVTYTSSDNKQVAQGDNFCSIVVPQIMASAAYQAGGAIVIWTDETEGGSTSGTAGTLSYINTQNDFNHTLTEIVISPFCKGNAYDSTLNYTHSSDVATMQKLFGLTANTPTGYLNDAANPSNATPAGMTGTSQQNGAVITGSGGTFTGTAFTQAASPTGGFGTGVAQDLSDLFQKGVVPSSIPGLNLSAGGYVFNRRTGSDSQVVTITNTLSTAITNPVYLVISNLSSNTTLLTTPTGTTANTYVGSPYFLVSSGGLAPGASASVSLQYSAPTSGAISSTMAAINTAGTP